MTRFPVSLRSIVLVLESLCDHYLSIYIGPGVTRRRFLSSDSGDAPYAEGAEPEATQWNSPTVDDIHLSTSHPVTAINTG